MINILIADDHPVVRRGLRELIEDEKDLKVQCEASSADEVLEKLKHCKVDLILLDISMPGKSGLDLISDLRNAYPDKPILILSALAEEIYAKRVIKLGAHGFLNKESAPELLISAIRKVHAGKKFVSTKLAEILVDEITHDANKSALEMLSSREFEVIRLIGMGKTIGEIAENLHLSANTISTYRTRILEKLGLKNNSEIIQYCINEKLFVD